MSVRVWYIGSIIGAAIAIAVVTAIGLALGWSRDSLAGLATGEAIGLGLFGPVAWFIDRRWNRDDHNNSTR